MNYKPSSPCPLLPREKGVKSPSPVGEGFRERAFQVYVSSEIELK
jgi:hypothetical protein